MASFLRLLAFGQLVFCFEIPARTAELTVDSDIAQCGRTVILYIGIRRVEQRHQYRDSPGVDKLLSILIFALAQRHLVKDKGRVTHLSVSC